MQQMIGMNDFDKTAFWLSFIYCTSTLENILCLRLVCKDFVELLKKGKFHWHLKLKIETIKQYQSTLKFLNSCFDFIAPKPEFECPNFCETFTNLQAVSCLPLIAPHHNFAEWVQKQQLFKDMFKEDVRFCCLTAVHHISGKFVTVCFMDTNHEIDAFLSMKWNCLYPTNNDVPLYVFHAGSKFQYCLIDFDNCKQSYVIRGKRKINFK